MIFVLNGENTFLKTVVSHVNTKERGHNYLKYHNALSITIEVLVTDASYLSQHKLI